MTYSSIDNTKVTFEKELDNLKSALAAWESVQVVTKKDGKPFANLQKNFINARVSQWQSFGTVDQKTITVTYCTKKSGYRSDQLYIWDGSYPAFRTFTVPEIITCIENRKEQLKKYISEYEHALSHLNELSALADTVQKSIDSLSNVTLKRAATSMIREMYFHS